LAMQKRLEYLQVKWREQGTEHPFRVRLGINTGYCNVGNFGSEDRMDYTIIGAEANLAARLQSIAPAGGIMLSYETYANVRHMVDAEASEQITMKGISRPIVPYLVRGVRGQFGEDTIITETDEGLSLTLDTAHLDPARAARLRNKLESALAQLEAKLAVAPPKGSSV